LLLSTNTGDFPLPFPHPSTDTPHSCCILLASKRFHINGKWHTLIDYDRFFELLKEDREFGPEEYVGESTPEWATWGNGGFNPLDERFYRKGKGPKAAVADGEGGCG